MGSPIDKVIPPLWLTRSALEVAPDLLGCTLVRRTPAGDTYRGRIVETEAYMVGDPACHGDRGLTPRTAPMFAAGGVAYVYLIYGMYHCFNVVTDRADLASAVLIRALELMDYPATLTAQIKGPLVRAAAGPGKLCRVLEIDRTLSGRSLQPSSGLWLEHRDCSSEKKFDIGVVQTTRIGIREGQTLPWRWYLKDSSAVSVRT
jgi:DNA-3-methyladenine glycosylase